MINICLNCHAVREYPDGHTITTCPRCDSPSIKHKPAPVTKSDRDAFLLMAITGDYPDGYFDN